MGARALGDLVEVASAGMTWQAMVTSLELVSGAQMLVSLDGTRATLVLAGTPLVRLQEADEAVEGCSACSMPVDGLLSLCPEHDPTR